MTDTLASRTYAPAPAKAADGLRVFHYECQVWTAGLFVCGILSIATSLCVSLVAIVFWLAPETMGSAERAIGIVLSAIIFSLLFATAHCMDRLGDARRRMKWAEYQMTDDSGGITR